MSRSPPASRRDAIAVALVLGALLASPFYYGGTIGAFAIFVAAGLLLLAASLKFPSVVDYQRIAPMLALTSLGYLLFVYQWSISADTSIVPTWSVALLPLTVLVVTNVARQPLRWLLAALFLTALVIAVVAAFRFVAFAERATLPLIDANNFATLMYLAWIPFVHVYVGRAGCATAWQHTAAVAVTIVMMIALFAAESRAGSAIVAVAVAAWMLLAVLGKVPWRPVAAICAGVIAAYLIVRVGVSAGDPSGISIERVGDGVDVRTAMVKAAWEMFREHPFTGVGLAAFRLFYVVQRPEWEQETLGAFVHNDYAQFLAEGGLPLCLLLSLFAAGAVVTFIRCAVIRPFDVDTFERAGLAMAISAACAHALVNFVFYIAPLALILGAIAGALWHGPSSVQQSRTPRVAALSGLGLGLGWIAWLFFALDNVSYGVFYAEPVPGTAWVRADGARALKYARIAASLNDDRALPVLGAASIVHQLALREPDSKYLRSRALADFREALARDPWNPVTYLNMAGHVASFPELTSELGDGESEEELLLSALAIDPDNAPAVDALKAHYLRVGTPEKYAALLEVSVLPRLEAFKRSGDELVERYMAELEAFAAARGDEALLARIAAERDRLANIRPVRLRIWGDRLTREH